MKVRIIKDRFGGMGWRAEPGVLHLGGVGTAGVESLSFALPEEWDGMAVTLHIEQEGGTLPQPVLLNESREVTIDRRFTAARQGLWDAAGPERRRLHRHELPGEIRLLRDH